MYITETAKPPPVVFWRSIMIIQISTVFSVLAFASTASIEYGNPLLHKDWVTDIPVITTGDGKNVQQGQHNPAVIGGIKTLDKQSIVDIHNKYRRIIAQNATNMMKLYWDDELSRTAQRHAQSCELSHDKLVNRRPSAMPGVYVGQNMCSGNRNWEECVKQWFDERNNYAYGYGTKTLHWTDIGHFTQLASWHITKVGCGYAECVGRTGRTSMVCNYAYGQYYEDIKQPWKNGSKCGDCPTTCDNGLCDCGSILCDNFGVLDVTTCTCKCLPFYSGATCEQVTCSKAEHPTCDRQTEHDCKAGVNIAAVCPKACGRCP